MIIDIHTHTFPDKLAATTIPKLGAMSHTVAFTDGTTGGLTDSMVRANVDYSLVLPVATSPRQVVRVNDASVKMNDSGLDTHVLSFGCMHPDFSDWHNELARIADLGLRGIKLHPIYQEVDFDDIRYLRILNRCGELGLMVMTHAGRDIGFPDREHCSPAMTLRAIQQVGPLTLLLAHMGGWRNWEQVMELLVGTGVYLDTSFALGSIPALDDGYYAPENIPLMDTDYFIKMVHAFGADHILFGSDSPWQGQRQCIDLIEALSLTDGEKAAILGGNAQRLLGLADKHINSEEKIIWSTLTSPSQIPR